MSSITFGADDRTPLTDAILDHLAARGLDVRLHGPPAGGEEPWAEVAELVARDVAERRAETGIVCCWTGTGVSIAANKVAGVRAALCRDAETARGARRWNDANVLCLSLAATSAEEARAIIDAWLEPYEVDGDERTSIERVHGLDGSDR